MPTKTDRLRAKLRHIFKDEAWDLGVEAEFDKAKVAADAVAAAKQMSAYFVEYVAPAFGYPDKEDGEPDDNVNLASYFYTLTILLTCSAGLLHLENERKKHERKREDNPTSAEGE